MPTKGMLTVRRTVFVGDPTYGYNLSCFRMVTEEVMTSRTRYTESARELAMKAIRVRY